MILSYNSAMDIYMCDFEKKKKYVVLHGLPSTFSLLLFMYPKTQNASI